MRVLALAGVLLAWAWPAHAAWVRLVSDHFVFVGEVPAREVRRMAERLELFHTVVSRVFAETPAPGRTTVLVFRNDRALTPFKPRFNGRPIAAAGYFLGGEEANYIALNAEQATAAFGLVFHEYTHALLSAAVGDIPPWLNEGLAQFYETFETRDDGRTVMLGVPDRGQLALLRSATLMPVQELTAVTRQSPLYNEGQRRNLFYAQSWALVHYLTFGSPERAAQLRLFLGALRQGLAASEAFRETFGPETSALDRELREYVAHVAFSAVRVQFDEAVRAGPTSDGSALPADEAGAYLGDLLGRLDRPDDARMYLAGILADTPGSARSIAALGMVELNAGRLPAALPLLERAATLLPDAADVHAAHGRALVEQAERAPAAAGAYDRAAGVLARALELDPQHVPAAVLLAAVELSRAGDQSRAVALMREVVRQRPGRENYRLMLARALAANGDYDEAMRLLGPLMGRGSTAEMRAAARELMAQVATVRNAGTPR